MEYFIGAAFALLSLYVFEKFIKPRNDVSKSKKAMTTQSYIFLMLRDYQDIETKASQPKPTQSMSFIRSTQTRILFMDDQAYWIEGSRLVVADAENGIVNKESMKEVDTMAMDKVQLDKTIFIVEKLKEGLPDEGGYPGKSKF
jgi:hypothetical protein